MKINTMKVIFLTYLGRILLWTLGGGGAVFGEGISEMIRVFVPIDPKVFTKETVLDSMLSRVSRFEAFGKDVDVTKFSDIFLSV